MLWRAKVWLHSSSPLHLIQRIMGKTASLQMDVSRVVINVWPSAGAPVLSDWILKDQIWSFFLCWSFLWSFQIFWSFIGTFSIFYLDLWWKVNIMYTSISEWSTSSVLSRQWRPTSWNCDFASETLFSNSRQHRWQSRCSPSSQLPNSLF